MRENQDGYRVQLHGIKIRCNSCYNYVKVPHSTMRVTMHPDDTTIYVAINKWNETNEKDPMPLRKRIAL